MASKFTEPQTDHGWRDEYSSEGMQTQRLALPSQAQQHLASTSQAQPLAKHQRNRTVALVLVVVGLLMLVGNFFNPFGSILDEAVLPGMTLLTIAGCFMFFAFWLRSYWAMIPGSILAGLGLGIMFSWLGGATTILWGLALGFLGIIAIGRHYFNTDSRWPIFPAVPLFGAGMIVAIAEAGLFLIWLPLIVVGLALYFGKGRRSVA
jgi:hypothetical protein